MVIFHSLGEDISYGSRRNWDFLSSEWAQGLVRWKQIGMDIPRIQFEKTGYLPAQIRISWALNLILNIFVNYLKIIMDLLADKAEKKN